MVRRFSSPVYDGDFPDPFVLPVGGGYDAYGTQTGTVNVQVMESADLVGWEHRGDALPELPPWAAPGRTWAPAVLVRDGAYVLYYALSFAAAGRQCISVATADDPAGPFVDRSAGPLIFQAERGGSWKSDDNALGRTPSLWGAPLQGDGLGLAGEPVELLQRRRRLGEAAGGGAELVTPAWATGTGPWLASAPGMAGPGGAEVFTDAAGGWRIAFHAWTPPRVGYDNGGVRSLWIEPLRFEDGLPRLG